MSIATQSQTVSRAAPSSKPFQACTQCRDRKLKCIMEASGDSTDGRPCKRCRRESKQCTLPPLKRKRAAPDTATAPPASKRQVPVDNNTTASRAPVQAPSKPPTVQTTKSVPPTASRRQTSPTKPPLSAQPIIRTDEDEEGEGDYIMSTAAPWALDFLPVTFGGTIADLSRAVQYHSPPPRNESDDTASLLSGTDEAGKSGATSQESASRQSDKGLEPLPDFDTGGEIGLYDGLFGAERLVKSPAETPSAFTRDLGLDDIFNFVKFG